MAARGLYEYKPLDRNSREIRLVTLLPPIDNSDTSVRCSICHHPLADAEYCALSYTWGNPTETLPILLNGFQFEVTTNLYAALNALQERKHAIPLWIDAICINQCDLEERSYEVQQMRDIYHSALTVLVWLGSQTPVETEAALSLICEFADRFEQDNHEGTAATSTWVLSPQCQRKDAWRALANLIDRPWFFRIWVIQEVVVAREVWLLCGSFSIHWHRLELGTRAISMYIMTALEGWIRTATNRRSKEGIYRFVVRLDLGLRRISLMWLSAFEANSGEVLPSFYEIVRRYNIRQATDPRDKIYALQGLADANRHPELHRLLPDYTNMGAKALFLQAARVHLEERGDLLMLHDACGPARPDHFPSWIPHWTPRFQTTRSTPMRDIELPPFILYKAGGTTSPIFSISENNEALTLKGTLIDRITTIGAQLQVRPGEYLGNKAYGYVEVLAQWAELVGVDYGSMFKRISPWTFGFTDQQTTCQPYATGDTIDRAFARTLAMNPKADMKMHYYDDQTYGFSRMTEYSSGKQDDIARLSQCCMDKKFFLTEQGYVGMGLQEIEEGDVVVVFLGGHTPFVLREERGGGWMVVGEAYVHGIMNGEAIQECESGKREWRDFLLV